MKTVLAPWMQERLADGQKPTDVAQVVLDIISDNSHQLRYQTSPKGRQTVASRHCDPTGETSIQEQEQLIRQLWQRPLEVIAEVHFITHKSSFSC